ncbi:hypothetical protein B0H63DRAFT_525105 [Podospora didyma]|uniref:Uncharacterized protein n=1 Tax=Podospora didyma TaxID=330526 RepID=A0AAE0KJL4_9PEZI|nr:hypothetical protein B0H63DRAFT_525105 [Podospora didyma]
MTDAKNFKLPHAAWARFSSALATPRSLSLRPSKNTITPRTKNTTKMPAIETSQLIAREAVSQFAKRADNWAAQEAGVVVVFCVVFLVAVGVLAAFIHKKLAARKAAKQNSF